MIWKTVILALALSGALGLYLNWKRYHVPNVRMCDWCRREMATMICGTEFVCRGCVGV